MVIFFGFFLLKIFVLHLQLPHDHPNKVQLRVFLIFFLGWFMLHSSSEQLFAYYQYTAPGIMLATYFSMAALTFHLAAEPEIGEKSEVELSSLSEQGEDTPRSTGKGLHVVSKQGKLLSES